MTRWSFRPARTSNAADKTGARISIRRRGNGLSKAVRAGMSEREKLARARKLNMARWHITPEQRRSLMREQLKETPEKSDR
jgi:hypothetical protein